MSVWVSAVILVIVLIICFAVLFLLFSCHFHLLFPACLDRALLPSDSPGRHLGDATQMLSQPPAGLPALELSPQSHSHPPSNDVICPLTPSVFGDRVVSPSPPLVPIKKSRLSLGRSYNSTRKSGNVLHFFIPVIICSPLSPKNLFNKLFSVKGFLFKD